MRAAVLSIGDELTLGQSPDTNSAWLSEQLASHGIIVDEHRTVGDHRASIAEALRELSRGRGVLIATGGLGPTADDVTREALIEVFTPGQELVEDPGALRWLKARFAGRTMPESNLRQILRPQAMRCIRNAHGTAPGLVGELDHCTIYALPGPPREMMPMFLAEVAPVLPAGGGEVLQTEKVNLFGMGESLAAERLGDLLDRGRTPLIGITESQSVISAHVRAWGMAEATRELVTADLDRIERLWQPYAFSRGDKSLAEVLLELMRENAKTLATAESCTGGWLGKSIVDVPGSSAYYVGGWVTYANEMKSSCLGVEAATIGSCGAVSREVAQAMAEGARDRSGADFALSITGIAGPEAASDKPVGLVFIGLANVNRATAVRKFEFPGDRTTIRDRSVKSAIQILRFSLLGIDERTRLLWET